MNNLVKKIVLVTIVFGMTTSMAQKENIKQKLTPEQKSEKVAQKMAKKLGLDDKQKESVRILSLKNIKEKRALKAEMKVLKNKRKAQREAHSNQLKNILTAEQLKKLAEIKAERKEKRKKKRKHRKEKHEDHK